MKRVFIIHVNFRGRMMKIMATHKCYVCVMYSCAQAQINTDNLNIDDGI